MDYRSRTYHYAVCRIKFLYLVIFGSIKGVKISFLKARNGTCIFLNILVRKIASVVYEKSLYKRGSRHATLSHITGLLYAYNPDWSGVHNQSNTLKLLCHALSRLCLAGEPVADGMTMEGVRKHFTASLLSLV